MSIIGLLLSGLWQGFLSLFGISDAQKLGRLEVKNADQEAQLKEKDYCNGSQSFPPISSRYFPASFSDSFSVGDNAGETAAAVGIGYRIV
jgi:hypothetical protein